jgi:hypothetical protein
MNLEISIKISSIAHQISILALSIMLYVRIVLLEASGNPNSTQWYLLIVKKPNRFEVVHLIAHFSDNPVINGRQLEIYWILSQWVDFIWKKPTISHFFSKYVVTHYIGEQSESASPINSHLDSPPPLQHRLLSKTTLSSFCHPKSRNLLLPIGNYSSFHHISVFWWV